MERGSGSEGRQRGGGQHMKCADRQMEELAEDKQTPCSHLVRHLRQAQTEKSGFAKARGKGMGICIADFNDDGWVDVFIANDTEPNLLYLNQGNGTFKK